MSELSQRDVERMANLCRIAITDAEKETFVGALSRILSLVEGLLAVDTTGLEEIYTVCEHIGAPREDVMHHSSLKEILAQAAPFWRHDHFVVPKVIDQG